VVISPGRDASLDFGLASKRPGRQLDEPSRAQIGIANFVPVLGGDWHRHHVGGVRWLVPNPCLQIILVLVRAHVGLLGG